VTTPPATPLLLPAALRRQIQAEGAKAYPNECCGIMIGRDVSGRRIVERLTPGRNTFEADEQYHRFSIDPLLQVRAEKEAEAAGKLVLGFYHSHPDHPARPSEYDREHAWPFYSYVIVAIEKGRAADITSWVLDDATNQFAVQDIIAGD
jgi:proteasome lid subunit RPN8/RPN11